MKITELTIGCSCCICSLYFGNDDMTVERDLSCRVAIIRQAIFKICGTENQKKIFKF